MTTRELTARLETVTQLSDGSRQGIEQLLEQADLVKFADFSPAIASKNLIQFAANLLETVEADEIYE